MSLSPSEYAEAFQNFKNAYSKSYAPQQEIEAFNNFKANLDGNINTGATLDGIGFEPTTVQPGVHSYFDVPAGEFLASRTGAIAPPAVVAGAAALSTAAISGIAAAVAVVVIGAVVAGAVVYNRKKSAQPKKQKLQEERSVEMIQSPSQSRIKAGIDVYSPKDERLGHKSITARSPAVDEQN